MIRQILKTGRIAKLRPELRLWIWPFVTTIILLSSWEVATRVYQLPAVVLPPPSLIGETFINRPQILLSNLWPTFCQIVLGFLLSVVGGIAVAILLTYSEIFRRGVYPLIVVAQIIPKVAVAPLLVLWFGMGDMSRLVLAFLVAFFPMVVNTVVGLTSVDSDTLRLARSYMGTRSNVFLKIRLPHALPNIFAGMKVSITLAVIGVIVAEFVASQRGIGYLIIWSNGLLDTPMMFSAIILLSVVGLALYGLIAVAEGLVVFWRDPHSLRSGGER
jgi:NitT/TauT family transport system permease protein